MPARGQCIKFQNQQFKRRNSARFAFDTHAMPLQRDFAGDGTETDRAFRPTRRITRTAFPKPAFGGRRGPPLRRDTAMLLLHLASLFLLLLTFQCSRNRAHSPPCIYRRGPRPKAAARPFGPGERLSR